jgi:hypothetical protein
MPHKAGLPALHDPMKSASGQIKKSGTATVTSLSSLPYTGRGGRLFGFSDAPPPYQINIKTGSGSPRRLTESRGNGATRRRPAPSSPVNGRMEREALLREASTSTCGRPSPRYWARSGASAAAKRVRINHRTNKSGTATGHDGLPSLSDMKETGRPFGVAVETTNQPTQGG